MSRRTVNKVNSIITTVILVGMYIIGKFMKMSNLNKFIFIVGIIVLLYSHFILKLDKKISSKLLYNYNLSRTERNAEKFIDGIKESQAGLDYSYLTGAAKSTFSKLYEAISKNDIGICASYLEKGVYDKYKEKIDFHMLNNERCVYENLELIRFKPVGVIHHDMSINDFVWFHIVYDGISYIKDDINGEIIDGTKKRVMNKEFWKFENQGNRTWKLCSILQEEGVDLRNDFKLVNEY